MSLLTFEVSAQSGLIARYYLNNNANNAVGANHGTVVGAVPTTDRFGVNNSAYSFNGSSSRIEFASPPLTQVTNWTVAAWVKPASFSQAGLAIFVGFDNGVDASDGYGFGLNGNSTLQGFTLYVGGYFSSGYSFPDTNQWYHIVMLRDTATIRFFVNGVPTPGTGNPSTVLPPTDFTIGSQNGARFFKGSMDDVRIYNRALTSNEVVQLYAANEGPCFPHAAAATPIMFNGFVVGATVTDGGCGYTNAPTVTILGGGGSGATATATVSNGMVTAVSITGAGCCYTNEPRFTFSSPPFPTSVSIKLSKVAITQHIMVGRTYVLEGTSDLVNWVAVGNPFTAQTEDVVTEVDISLGYRYFRSREVRGNP